MTAGLRVQRGGPSDIDTAARLFQAYLRFYEKSVPADLSERPARRPAFAFSLLNGRTIRK